MRNVLTGCLCLHKIHPYSCNIFRGIFYSRGFLCHRPWRRVIRLRQILHGAPRRLLWRREPVCAAAWPSAQPCPLWCAVRPWLCVRHRRHAELRVRLCLQRHFARLSRVVGHLPLCVQIAARLCACQQLFFRGRVQIALPLRHLYAKQPQDCLRTRRVQMFFVAGRKPYLSRHDALRRARRCRRRPPTPGTAQALQGIQRKSA